MAIPYNQFNKNTHMKRKLPFLLLLALITSGAYAQKVYFKLNPSYNFGMKDQVLSYDYSLRYSAAANTIVEEYSNVRTSLGKGYMGSFAIGFKHNENVSSEYTFSYLKGKPSSFSDIIHYYSGDEKYTTTLEANIMSFTPTLVFSATEKDWTPYLAAGLSINFITVKENTEFSSFFINGNTVIDAEYKGSPTIGFTTKIGVINKISDVFSVFGEFTYAHLNFSPNTKEVTGYTINKQDSLSTLKEYDIHTEYENEISIMYEDNGNGFEEKRNMNKPREARKFSMPLSYFSFSIGVRINIVRREKPNNDAIKIEN